MNSCSYITFIMYFSLIINSFCIQPPFFSPLNDTKDNTVESSPEWIEFTNIENKLFFLQSVNLADKYWELKAIYQHSSKPVQDCLQEINRLAERQEYLAKQLIGPLENEIRNNKLKILNGLKEMKNTHPDLKRLEEAIGHQTTNMLVLVKSRLKAQYVDKLIILLHEAQMREIDRSEGMNDAVRDYHVLRADDTRITYGNDTKTILYSDMEPRTYIDSGKTAMVDLKTHIRGSVYYYHSLLLCTDATMEDAANIVSYINSLKNTGGN